MKRMKFAGAVFLALFMILTPMTASAAPTVFMEEAGQEYAAPAYGTKAKNAEKIAFYEQVEAACKVLQPSVDAVAPLTVGHNVSIVNYSDPNELGLIYESDGSGVIIAIDDNTVYIATAAHCLKRAHTEVTFADGTKKDAAVVYRNPASDVGFAVVSRTALSEQTLAVIKAAPGMDAQSAGKVTGDTLYAVNMAPEVGGIFPGLLDNYSVVYPNNPQQNVLQFFSTVSHGSSGGALYTPEGIWVGSVSGGDNYGICWAVPYSDILKEFNAWLTILAMQVNAAG